MASEYDVAVVGLGVIGLPFAAVLAEAGHRVLGVDVDAARIRRIQEEKFISDEREVDELVVRVRKSGRLDVSTELSAARHYVICVPTPLEHKAKRADLTYVYAASETVARVARPGDLVVVESTIPPGTVGGRVRAIFERAGKSDVLLAHAPERLLPGNVLHELRQNDRVVGGTTPDATTAAARLYRSFAKGEVFETDADTAEMVKILENTFRDVNVALANELALICRNAGVDPANAFTLANRHPRVDLLFPGIGVGGHCLPVDPWFLHEIDPENAILVATARRVNDAVPIRIATEIQRWATKTGCSRVVLIGKSYKADVWDPRESPAVQIGELLVTTGMDVTMWDPLEPGSGSLPASDPQTGLVLLVTHKDGVDAFRTASGWRARASAVKGRLVPE